MEVTGSGDIKIWFTNKNFPELKAREMKNGCNVRSFAFGRVLGNRPARNCCLAF
jgi:hypothetical protein